MKRKFVSLVVCLAFMAVLVVPAALAPIASAAGPPVWHVNDNWTYDLHYDSGTAPPVHIVQDHTMLTTISNATGDNFIQDANYLPDYVGDPPAPADKEAHRHTLIPGTGYSPVTVLKADVSVKKTNMQFQQEEAVIFAYGVLADNATITFDYDAPLPTWPPVVDATWTFSKNTTDFLDIVDYTVERTGKVLEKVDCTVPKGTYSCWHIQEYDNDPYLPWDPLTPNPNYGNVTYEHWFNEEDVKSDVKMVDNETYKGTETRVLTDFSVTSPIEPSQLGNGKGNKMTPVVISGTGFVVGKGTKVLLKKSGQKDLTGKKVTVVSDTEINCSLNLIKAVPGLWDVVVVNKDKTEQTFAEALTVTACPEITFTGKVPNIDPLTCKLGTNPVSLTINGLNFQDDATVKLTKGKDTLAAPVDSRTGSTQIVCHFDMQTVPPAALGSWKVFVTNGDGGYNWKPPTKIKVVKP